MRPRSNRGGGRGRYVGVRDDSGDGRALDPRHHDVVVGVLAAQARHRLALEMVDQRVVEAARHQWDEVKVNDLPDLHHTEHDEAYDHDIVVYVDVVYVERNGVSLGNDGAHADDAWQDDALEDP